MRKKPNHICKSFRDAFVYDSYRNYKGRFRFAYLFDMLMYPVYSSLVLMRLSQYYFWKWDGYREIERRNIFQKIAARFYHLFYKVFRRINYSVNAGFEPSPLADIKPGLFIHHCQGIVIGGDTRIGESCHLFKNVLFGEKDGGCPSIGDNVVLYANTVIVGGITIADNAVVAPNSVVLHDVEKDSIVSGNPARSVGTNRYRYVQPDGILKRILREDDVCYDAMQTD